MELTEIKYWVFAHTSYETTGKIPSNLKLYCCNPDAKITQPKQVYPNNTYIGIMPYSKEVWDYYNPKGKSWKDKDGEHWTCENTKPTACMLFELDFKYIVFLFEQIHLLEDYPDNTTSECPVIDVPIFYKTTTEKVAAYTEEYQEMMKLIENYTEADKEYWQLYENLTKPVLAYFKLHSFKFNTCSPSVDISEVGVKSWLDQSKIHFMHRTKIDLKDIWSNRRNITFIDQEEFDKAFKQSIEEFYNS